MKAHLLSKYFPDAFCLLYHGADNIFIVHVSLSLMRARAHTHTHTHTHTEFLNSRSMLVYLCVTISLPPAGHRRVSTCVK